MGTFKDKLVRLAHSRPRHRAAILAALRVSSDKRKIKVRRKDTGREVWVYPENVRGNRDYMNIQKEHRPPESKSSIVMRILRGYSKLCLYSEDDRETISRAVGPVLNKPTPQVVKFLESHNTKCLDNEEGRKGVLHALLKMQ